MPAPLFSSVGERFGRLVVVRPAPNIGERRAWACFCDCGRAIVTTQERLRNGQARSCGCLHLETARKNGKRNRKHGQQAAQTPTYYSWQSMIARCFYKKDSSYQRYGARGITVCERWRRFADFFADMGPRPAGLTLDRILSSGNYEPGNCRWATPEQQANNRRVNVRLTYEGETKTIAEWARTVGVQQATLHHRIKAGWPVARILAVKDGRTERI